MAALCEPSARVLVVQATGWGKSAVYWAATAIRRSEGAGPTLVVSPLLSLMRDQVAAAARAGLRAATLNSSNIDEWSAIEAELAAGTVDVLLVSPERLANPGFGRRVLDRLAGRIGLLVIDEAHAVSDWGHDFRPDYRRVSDVLRRLNPETPVLATTATANARVTDDVAAQLGDVDAGPARAARPVQPPAGGGRPAHPDPALRLGGRPPAAAAGLGHRLHADRGRRPTPGGGDPRGARGRGTGRGVHRRARPGRPDPARGRPARQPAQGAGRDVGARHGLRQARPRLRGPCRLAAVAGVLLPAGRPRRARHRPRARRAAPVRRRRRRLGLLRDRDHPRPRPGRAAADRVGELRRRPARLGPGARGRDGASPHPGRAHAQAARRRRRGRPGRGRLAPYRGAVGVRRRALRRHRRGPTPRGRHHARLHPRRAVPHAAAAGVPRRPDRSAVRPLLGVHRVASTAAGGEAVTRPGPGRVDGAAPRDVRARAPQDVARGRLRPGADPAGQHDRRRPRAGVRRRPRVARRGPRGVRPGRAGDRGAPDRAASTCSGAGVRAGRPAPRSCSTCRRPASRSSLRPSQTTWRRWAGSSEPSSTLEVARAPSADLTSADEAAAWRDAITVGPEAAAAIADRVVLLVVDATSTQWPITVAGAAIRTAGASRVLPLLLHRRP